MLKITVTMELDTFLTSKLHLLRLTYVRFTFLFHATLCCVRLKFQLYNVTAVLMVWLVLGKTNTIG